MKRSVPFLLSLVLFVGLVGTAASTTPVPENLPLALEEQRRLIAEQPDNAAARNDLGNLLMLMGDTMGAELAYRGAVELAPHRPAYHYNLALLLHDAGKAAEAAELYRRVLELDPTDAWAHYQLGAILEAQGKDRRAVGRYARAFHLDPGLAFADVNPLVLESDLVTEAMLRGYKEGMIASRAPRVYNDPNRIARLLVVDREETGVEDEAEEPPAGMRAEDEPEGMTMGQEPDEPGPPSQRKVLNQKDISDRPVNQASPQPRAGYRPPAARSESPVRSIRPSQDPAREEGDAARQRRGNQGRDMGGTVVVGGSAPGDNDDEPTVGGPSDPRSRPDFGDRTPNPIGSTGSLQMEWEPEETTRNG